MHNKQPNHRIKTVIYLNKKILLCLPNTIERDDKNVKTERLVIEDLGQRQRIVARVHDSGHLGINRSLDMVASKYYWPGLSKDVIHCLCDSIILYCRQGVVVM